MPYLWHACTMAMYRYNAVKYVNYSNWHDNLFDVLEFYKWTNPPCIIIKRVKYEWKLAFYKDTIRLKKMQMTGKPCLVYGWEQTFLLIVSRTSPTEDWGEVYSVLIITYIVRRHYMSQQNEQQSVKVL